MPCGGISLKWKDTSSYSQGEKRDQPKTMSIRGTVYISVHHHMYHPPDLWLVTAPGFFNNYPLKSKILNDAMKEALRLVRNKLRLALKELKEVE